MNSLPQFKSPRQNPRQNSRAVLGVLAVIILGGLSLKAGEQSRLDWWRQARFGMFIHWGPVSPTGKEISWSRANTNPQCPNHGDTPADIYDNLYKQFNPTQFKADDWARIATQAGMKYMILTAKHGDGFLLWNSKVDGYNIGATPFRRDVCAELASAARQHGLHLGWYFSPMDWRDPDCRSTNQARFITRMQGELRELLSGYGRIDVLWFDSDGRPAIWDPATTYPLVRELQPQILINNRLEMGNQEQWEHQGKLGVNEDFYTPEQRVGAYDDRTPWETCMTLGTQWSWKPNDQIKSAQEVIGILARCVGGDGNLLLDVGPMPDGRIEPRQVRVLEEVGRWLAANGESIYATRGGPWKPSKNLASTRKGRSIYLHILGGKTNPLELPNLAAEVKSAAVLNGGKVAIQQTRDTLRLTVTSAERNPLDTVVKLELAGTAMTLPAIEVLPKMRATASNVYDQDLAKYGPEQAFDEDPTTRWATDAGTRRAWIAAAFDQPRTISGVEIDEVFSPRVRKFEFQYRDGQQWKTVFQGTELGAGYKQKFAPIVAREFRLSILDATEGPSLREIRFEPIDKVTE